MPKKQPKGFGALFTNNNTNPNAPGHDGHATCPVCGTWLKISAWVKTAANGTKFLNLKLQRHQSEADPGDDKTQSHLPKTVDEKAPF